ncbi:transcriptional regulator FtsR [Streptomyces sp. L7]|uniref:transcriptional regulator FtsR n=1 Tax=Streptomyces sp. L7 TaxID=3423954 RepID=UPI003D978B31
MARQAARAHTAPPALLSIGQVLARLTPEFPDLSSSKLRFLEERGLISPSRTASGYRKFSPADVERLHTVLAMQRDNYLPLKVIKKYLAAVDAGRARRCRAVRAKARRRCSPPAAGSSAMNCSARRAPRPNCCRRRSVRR